MSESKINARFLLNEQGDPREINLHKVIYNISRFEENSKILLKNILILMHRYTWAKHK